MIIVSSKRGALHVGYRMKTRNPLAWFFSVLLLIGAYCVVCIGVLLVFHAYRVSMFIGATFLYWGVFAFLAYLRNRASDNSQRRDLH